MQAEGLADAFRVLAPLFREVALGAAVFKAEALRVAESRVGYGVTHEDHLAAVAEQVPKLVVRARMESSKRQEQRENSHHSHSAA
jgi:hypothetical protein